jgi:hypothetical protein
MPKNMAEASIKKIIVNASHELTDIIKDIHSSKEERIVLTFTDQTDILISPINLKVLQEVAEEEGKLLIAQIIQNPTGVRNSKLAGIKVIETPSAPTQQDWEEAAEEIVKQEREKISKKKLNDLAKEEEVAKKSSFEDRVNNALNKRRKEKGYEDRRGLKPDSSFISIDKDLPSNEKKESLAGKDFAPTVPDIDDEPPARIERIQPLGRNLRPKFKGINFKAINFKDKKVIRIVIVALLLLLVLPGVGFAIYNQMAPLVKVKIFVEAKPVEIEKIFTGDSNIDEIDFDNLKIPIKVEEIEKSLSDTVTPTGKAFKGDKAKGVITLTYTNTEGCNETNTPITLPAGQRITATTGEVFVLITSAQLTCPKIIDVNVEALDIGTEYNINSGKAFSVAGYSSSLLSGFNANTFTGGSKQEYTVLSQQDLDSALESLTETAIEQMKSDLRSKETSWEIIEDSIKSEVNKDSIKTDKKVGEEASVVNLEVTIKGSATYYLTKNLNEGLTDLLREEAILNNLFETDDNMELELGDNIEKTLKVDTTVKDSVQINLTAQSSVRPKINKEDIENKLKGMKWEEGLQFISTLNFSDQKTEVLFIPENYPEFLKRFPNRRGGVLVSIVELEIEK